MLFYPLVISYIIIRMTENDMNKNDEKCTIATIIEKIRGYEVFEGKILENEALAPKTTFKIGGKARLFIAPENYNSFQKVISILVEMNQKFFILGGGSNVVFPDDDFEPVVISTHAFNDVETFKAEDLPFDFGKVELEDGQVLVTCFSGTPMASFVNFCTENNISGAEEFAGLPGTIGGAVYMNARCFNKSISDILFSVSYMDYSTSNVKLRHSRFNPAEWDYKKSPFQNSRYFITTTTFLLEQKTSEQHQQIADTGRHFIVERISKGHFKFPSAGSVFKNNHSFGKPSGQIIDEAGLRGYSIGGAQVAPFHGNFIINTGNARSEDVKALVKHIQEIVLKKYSFKLEPEIIFVDNL